MAFQDSYHNFVTPIGEQACAESFDLQLIVIEKPSLTPHLSHQFKRANLWRILQVCHRLSDQFTFAPDANALIFNWLPANTHLKFKRLSAQLKKNSGRNWSIFGAGSGGE